MRQTNNLIRMTPVPALYFFFRKILWKYTNCHGMACSQGLCSVVVRLCVMMQKSKMHGFHSALAQANAHDVNVMANVKC